MEELRALERKNKSLKKQIRKIETKIKATVEINPSLENTFNNTVPDAEEVREFIHCYH